MLLAQDKPHWFPQQEKVKLAEIKRFFSFFFICCSGLTSLQTETFRHLLQSWELTRLHITCPADCKAAAMAWFVRLLFLLHYWTRSSRIQPRLFSFVVSFPRRSWFPRRLVHIIPRNFSPTSGNLPSGLPEKIAKVRKPRSTSSNAPLFFRIWLHIYLSRGEEKINWRLAPSLRTPAIESISPVFLPQGRKRKAWRGLSREAKTRADTGKILPLT